MQGILTMLLQPPGDNEAAPSRELALDRRPGLEENMLMHHKTCKSTKYMIWDDNAFCRGMCVSVLFRYATDIFPSLFCHLILIIVNMFKTAGI